MNILIFGSGAVGIGLASCLVGREGCEVTLVARKNTLVQLHIQGLSRTGIFGQEHHSPDRFRAVSSLAELPAEPFDIILICTKSQDSAAAAQAFIGNTHVYDQSTIFVMAQNGWGNAQIFAGFHPGEQVYNARVITGFYKPQPHVSAVTVHAQDIHLGCLYHDRIAPRIEQLAAIINQTISCKTTDAIGKDIWAKMLYNCALNPLGAIRNVHYGKLGEQEESRVTMNAAIAEIFTVMQLHGFTTHWQTPQEYQALFYEKLLPLTYDHESSMLQDIRARRKTEIEALNGAVVALGQQKSYAAPVNASLTHSIRLLESNYL